MATYYITVNPVDALSTSTYSIYFDEVKPSNLMLSGVPLSTLSGGLLVYFTGSAASATSVYVKNEDPDCCCAVQSYIFPTPSPTTAPTTAAPTTAAPTTAAPTTAAPTTAAPTTAAPTTAAPTTAAPTTPTPTAPPPVGPTYYYYDIYKYNCNLPSGPCTVNSTGLVARTNEILVTTGYYYNIGDGFVYQPQTQITPAPSTWDVDLIDPQGAADCLDACQL